MASELKWKAASSRTTGIAGSSMAAGANVLGSEIDNATNEDRWITCELTWTTSATSLVGEVVELYLLYAINGTAYEDGAAATDPKKAPVAVFVNDGGTGAQKQVVSRIPLDPFKFKLLIKSELTEACTADSVTLLAYTYNEEGQ